ncbi:MFS transporter [Sciscionella sediminilitoris]|uniref:MFS transporter n=1 Tax=Sciscionella sediminilitoris TaxID=1445613 RepID=UPI0004DEDD01|nr:MFS transporter [Sciscionella sp. SE31]
MSRTRFATYENGLLAILFTTFGFVFFDRLALNFLIPFAKEELHLDNTEIGLLGGIPALAWAVTGAGIGALSDRFDSRKPLLLGAVACFTVFSALSGFAAGFLGLFIFRLLMGASEGAVLPLSQPLMLAESAPRRRGLNMGLLQGSSAGLLGGIVAPIVTVWIGEHYGWRTAFYLTIIPGAIMFVLIARFVRNRRLAPERSERRRGGVRTVLRERNVLLCLAIAVFYISWFITTQTFAPLYLTQVKGYSPTTMSLVSTGMGIAWVLWGALVPGFSDRFGRKPAMLLFTALAVLCPLAIVYLDSPYVLLPVLVLTFTGMGCFTLYMATIPAETVPRHLVATALGLIMGLGEAIGGFVVPTVAGGLADSYGVRLTMFIASGAALIVLTLSTLLTETAPRVVHK